MLSNPVIANLLCFSKIPVPPSAVAILCFDFLLKLPIHSPFYLMTLSYMSLKEIQLLGYVYIPPPPDLHMWMYPHPSLLSSSIQTNPFHFIILKGSCTSGYPLSCLCSFFLSYFSNTKSSIDNTSLFSYHSLILYCLNSQKCCLHIFSPCPHLFFILQLIPFLFPYTETFPQSY